MKELIFKSEKVDDTKKLANLIASLITKGDLILLKGELGTGKTTFVKGFLKGLGYDYTVSSPTFTLINNYDSWNLSDSKKTLILH